MRYFDGVSAESLGSVPKIITISREEQRLLSKIRPWKFFRYATNQGYLRLLDRRNAQQLSISRSIRMTKARADPNSAYNGPEYRLNISRAMLAIGDEISKWMRARRVLDKQKYGPSGMKNPKNFSRKISTAVEKEWKSFSPRARARRVERLKHGWAWTKLSDVMRMLFDGIVDENVESFPCPHCSKVCRTPQGLGYHITCKHHNLRDLDELELQSYQNMVWAYHTNGYMTLTGRQKRSLRGSGLIYHGHGVKEKTLTKFGRDILSSIDVGNAPLVRL